MKQKYRYDAIVLFVGCAVLAFLRSCPLPPGVTDAYGDAFTLALAVFFGLLGIHYSIQGKE